MKKFTMVLLLALTGLSMFANAQTFTKTYGTPASEYGACAVRTTDGGYALLVNDATTFDIYKTDSLGTVQWQQNYSYGTTGSIGRIIQTNDGGYAVIGETYSAPYNAGNYSAGIVIKVNSTGVFQWYTSLVGASYGESGAADIVQNSASEYICAATIQHHADYGGVNDYPSIIKLSSTGSILWSHAIANTEGNASGVCIINGNQYLITGDGNDVYGSGYSDILLAKYDNSGNQSWVQYYNYAPNSGSNLERGESCKILSSGEISIAGFSVNSSNNSAVIIKTDASGNELWHQLYGNSNRFFDVVATSDGNIVCTGYFGTDLEIYKVLSTNGTTIWNYPFSSGLGNSIREMPNSDLLIFGSTNNHGAGGYDAWLLRLNSSGTLCTTPSQAATPTGTTQFCINPPNTTYATTGANNATAYVWEILPSNAGTITGTGTSATVVWNSSFTGTATIQVMGTNGTGCNGSYSNALTVTVNALPNVSFTALNSVCINTSPFTLSGGSPSGGIYSGTGVSNNIFNPATAGVGTFTITYSYTNGGTGCSNTATQNITVNSLPSVSFNALNSVCLNTSPFTLYGGTPSGGTYSGNGVSNNIFNPANAGVGTFTITYSYINSSTGCSNTATQNITVNSLPSVSLSAFNSVCANASPFTLSGGTPAGGTYSGTGVSNNIFNPANAGVGTFTITYSYTNSGTGCSNSASQNITVNALPNVSFMGLNSSYCQNAAAVTLTGSPAGGSFSGAGMNGSTFNPAVAGVGTHSVSYTVTQNGCTNSATQNVTVNSIPQVSFSGLNPSYSTSDNPSTLTGSPAGGIFSGDGISGNIFNPAIAGIGSHNIVYIYTDGNGCSNASCQTTDLATKLNGYKSPDNTINIFPNPNDGSFQINFDVQGNQGIRIDVLNNIGKIIYTESKNSFNGKYFQTIDLSSFAKGIYLINTRIGDKVFANKVTIQ